MYSMPGFPTTGPVCTQLMVVACAAPVAIGSRVVATAVVMAASLFTEFDVTGVLHGRQISGKHHGKCPRNALGASRESARETVAS
jgi:hypothetical protein